MTETKNLEIKICPDLHSLAEAGANLFAKLSQVSIIERGTFRVALSGGSTPKTLHQVLTSPAIIQHFDWDHTQFFWGDEREVPPDHPQSNFRMAQETLFAHISTPAANIHRIETEEGALRAAQAYEYTLQTVFGITNLEKEKGLLPVFDLILLGIGTDGHTASLFPGTKALDENKRWVIANDVPALGVRRITLSLPVINAAKHIIFLAAGKEKANIVSQILNSCTMTVNFPAQWVNPKDGAVTWLLDKQAASMLKI